MARSASRSTRLPALVPVPSSRIYTQIRGEVREEQEGSRQGGKCRGEGEVHLHISVEEMKVLAVLHPSFHARRKRWAGSLISRCSLSRLFGHDGRVRRGLRPGSRQGRGGKRGGEGGGDVV
eukprot:scaffold258420_cov33-Tisochrysis_lutea.AAC.3